MGVSETAKLVAELSLDDKLSKGVKTAMGSIGKLEKGMSRVGKGAGQISRGMTSAGTKIGAAAVGGVALATKAFIDWEDAFAGVVKTVDQADLSKAGLTFDDLSKGLRDMSTEMPNSALELAGIAEAAGALGIKAKDILSFTKQVAILASTTDVSADDAATALGQLQNVIGLTGDEFDNFAATLVQLGNTGASTESTILEITRRAGGAAKAIHLSKDATLAFASATANLGLEAEAGGTNLGKFFDVAQQKFLHGSKTLQDLMGETSKELRQTFTKDPQQAIRDLLAHIGKLKGAEQLDVITTIFGKNAIMRRLVRDLAGSLDKNLDPALKESAKAWEEATAAQAEFDKRNATVKSSIERLRNNLFNLGVTLGEGVAPAISRVAEKLSNFLKDPANASQVKALGEDIGKAIDGVDWKDVLAGAQTFIGILKTALDYAKHIFDLINALPTEVKAAGLGLIGLNKLSGGLIGAGLGNVVGGLAQTIIKGIGAQLPGVGRAFAQPVFVTNWPVGGLGGGVGGAAGKTSLLGKAGAAVAIAAPIIGVIAQWMETNAASSAHASEVHATSTSQIARKDVTAAELHTAMAGVEQGIKDITSNPLLVLVQGDALTQLQHMRGEISAALASTENNAGKNKDDQVNATDRVEKTTKAATKQSAAAIRDKVESANIKAVAATNRAKASADSGLRETAGEARFAGVRTGGAVDRAGGNIVAAIHGIPAPIVNVSVSASQVTTTQTQQRRNGGGGSSRNKDRATPQ